MSSPEHDSHFPALLRFWRNARGLSQLDLASAADVSSRHLSYLETGKSQPSREMLLGLGRALQLQLRELNAMLVAAGYSAAYSESDSRTFSSEVNRALQFMMKQQEPYPLLVLNRGYEITASNHSAQSLISRLLGCTELREKNSLRLVFDPALLRPQIENWGELASSLLHRLQGELLQHRNDSALRDLLSSLAAYPDVPESWRVPDWSQQSSPTLPFRFRYEGETYAFLTTMTVFQAPQDIALEEMRIESYYPLDDATHDLCVRLASR